MGQALAQVVKAGAWPPLFPAPLALPPSRLSPDFPHYLHLHHDPGPRWRGSRPCPSWRGRRRRRQRRACATRGTKRWTRSRRRSSPRTSAHGRRRRCEASLQQILSARVVLQRGSPRSPFARRCPSSMWPALRPALLCSSALAGWYAPHSFLLCHPLPPSGAEIGGAVHRHRGKDEGAEGEGAGAQIAACQWG